MSRDERRNELALLAMGSTTATIGAVLAIMGLLMGDWIAVAIGLGIAWFAGQSAWGRYVQLRDDPR